MKNRTIIDLSKLPRPSVIEPLDYEAIRAATTADFASRYGDKYQLLPSDPAVKVLEAGSYRELLVRNKINESARQVLPAFADDINLAHIALRNGTIATAGESRESLLDRLLTAEDLPSTAGSDIGYTVHALKAAPPGVLLDARPLSPSPGAVEVWCLFDPAVPASDRAGHLVTIKKGLDLVRPLTDYLKVFESPIKRFKIHAQLELEGGADPDLVLRTATLQLRAEFKRHMLVGSAIPASVIYAAIHRKNDVKSAVLLDSPGGVTVAPYESPLLDEADDAIRLEVKE